MDRPQIAAFSQDLNSDRNPDGNLPDRDIQVLGSGALLSTPFLGQPIEICIVTPDLRKTLNGLVALGIGPFQIYRFSPSTVSEMTYAGQPAIFEIEVAFAQPGGATGMIWEVMSPVSGPSVMREFLENTVDGNGGIHHVAFDCGDGHGARLQLQGDEAGDAETCRAAVRLEAARRRAEFERRGFPLRQSGVWHGKRGCVEFMYFDTTAATTTCFESYVFSADWEDPDEVEIFPNIESWVVGSETPRCS